MYIKVNTLINNRLFLRLPTNSTVSIKPATSLTQLQVLSVMALIRKLLRLSMVLLRPLTNSTVNRVSLSTLRQANLPSKEVKMLTRKLDFLVNNLNIKRNS